MKDVSRPSSTMVYQVIWNLQRLEDMLDQMCAWATLQGWPESLRHKCRLLVEELVVNALTHGGRTEQDGQLQVRITDDALQLQIEVLDNGRAFDPFSLPEPDLEADLDSRQVGGLGVFLVKALCAQYSYVREGDTNHVRLQLLRDG